MYFEVAMLVRAAAAGNESKVRQDGTKVAGVLLPSSGRRGTIGGIESATVSGLIETVQQLDGRPVSDLMELLSQVRPAAVFPATHRGIQ